MSRINDLAKCDAAYFALKQQLKDAEYNLAAAQAREKVLRDALFELANLHVVVYSQSPEGRTYMKKLGDLMASSDDTALNKLLAEGQAREKVLLSALAKVKAHVTGEAAPNWSGGEATYRSRGYLADVCEVANQPSGDTALKALLKAERERLAVIAEKLGKELAEMNEDSSMKFVGGSIACAIRALEDN